MAKMFYTMDETKAALGKSEDEIKQLAKDGKLREFRDGPRLMFKADQVDSLKGEPSLGGDDQISLGSGDTHAPLGLAESKSGSGTGFGMKSDTAAGTPSPAPAAIKDDTASGMDVGLSGSLSGSIGGGSLAGGSMGGSLGGTGTGSGMGSSTRAGGMGKPGVNVFGDESNEPVDPMAQTHITPSKDQISLEGVGSGSGLLDLTRETDDTSLGAALLDEISPGGGKRVSPTPGAAPLSSGSTAGMTSISPMEIPAAEPIAPTQTFAPMTVEADDPVAPAFSGAAMAASIMVILSGLVLINALVGDNPFIPGAGQIQLLAKDNAAYMFLGVGVLLAIILFVVGIFAGKSRSITA